jgi:cellulose synthase/poly-beta-1,6-N-acetylglucosamine synthase-like glycosyltransferase
MSDGLHILCVIAFWASAAAVVWAYVAYPLVIWLVSRGFGRAAVPPSVEHDALPSITLLIAAHNEEAVIAERARNALATAYPHDRLRVMIVSDGSTDRTAEIVRRFAGRGVLLMEVERRQGKAAVLNAAMTEIDTDVVAFSDANTMLDRDAMLKLARWFRDPAVGVVCGRLVLIDPATGKNGDGLYWRYETFLKKCEARLGALLGSNGAIYAMRRERYVPIPANTVVDDFVIPLTAKLRSGCRIVYDPDAVATEDTANDLRGEFYRRVRIGAGGFQAIGILWRLLDPRQGWLAFAFLSHKGLRWLCPFALLTMLFAAAALASVPFFRFTLVGQLIFYLCALGVALLPGAAKVPRALRLAPMFAGMNVALLVGFVRWLRGVRSGAWARTERGESVLDVASSSVDWSRGVERWIVPYALSARRRRTPETGRPLHLLLCIADHFEPRHGNVGAEQAAARVEKWVREYPRRFDRFRDDDGRPPRHTFFFPIDEYDPLHVDSLAELCQSDYGEIEIHHHHDHDTADALRERLLRFKRLFRHRHGVLPQHRASRQISYGFVHGNWALDNSRPDGRWCGVNNELDVLRETGCYADFTLPSAPSPTQTRKINSIYYATDDPRRPKSHDRGVDVGSVPRPQRSLMLIQGPLLLDWRHRTGPGRLFPHIENANIQHNQAPTMHRLDLWLCARVQVPSRADWFFVKLHTHGATEPNQQVLLGRGISEFHESLAQRAAQGDLCVHYVTAREMYNLARAAEAGWTGSVEDARDWELVLPESRLASRPPAVLAGSAVTP